MNDREKITILVERVIYRNPQTSWAVVSVTGNGGQFTANGILPQVSPQQTLEATGNWREHPRYGRQFAISSAYPSRSYTVDSISKYLCSGKFKGIGKQTARKIVDTFGSDTMKILTHDGNKLLTIPKIPKKAVYNLIATWKDSLGEAEVLTALADLQIPLHLGHKILEKYEERALEVVQKDPYKIPFAIKGFGFKSADRVGLTLGLARDSVKRIRGAIDYFLRMNEDNGHCFMKRGQLAGEIEKNLPLSLAREPARQNFTTALQEAEEENHVASDQSGGHDIYYRNKLYAAEELVARRISKMVACRLPPVDIDGTLAAYGDSHSTEQIEAASNSFCHQLSVLTGAAGTGKTTTVKLIIEIAKDLELKLALCAPTGRAACRLKELTGIEAKTIHRLLEWLPHKHRFKRDHDEPLEEEMIVVDEVSMVDIRLAQALFLALKSNTRVLLVGDANQLPSVGPGNFLADLLKCHQVPTTKLSKIFRQDHSSQIIVNAHRIIHNDRRGYVTGREFFLIEQPVDRIVGQIRRYLEEFPEAQILSPIYRGSLGIDALNGAAKRWKHGANYQPEFQLGDKVIQTNNNYELGVYNGDIGHIVSIDKKNRILTVNFEERAVHYRPLFHNELRLAYAISIHKSQGSEFSTVIMPIVRQHYIMLNKNLIYTAITRAKDKIIVIGSKDTFKFSAQKNYDLSRQTLLTERIGDQFD